MFKPIKIAEVELTKPIEDFEGLQEFEKLQVLVRMYNIPIGYIHLPLPNGRCSATILSQSIIEQYYHQIAQLLIRNGLAALIQNSKLNIADLVNLPPLLVNDSKTSITVAVCTRNRTTDLALCLDALCGLDYPHLEILVVDNAPSTNDTALLVKNHYPSVRYICEPRPGLSWARNRAVLEAEGEIIAFTDDDVIVDAGWVKALASVFAESPEVMAVTGLVVPYELETQAQVLFERHGGFGKGFQRKSWSVAGKKMSWRLLGAGQFGTGANMAFRCCVFKNIGLFNTALGAGTVTHGAEDLEMFFRVLKEGHKLVYEPSAIVRHRHRRDYSSLCAQLTSDGIGLYSYFKSGATNYPNQRSSFWKLGVWWLIKGNLKPLWTSLKHPTQFPRDLIIAELKGCFAGMNRYQKACRIAAEIEGTFGPLPVKEIAHTSLSEAHKNYRNAIAIRIIELSDPLPQLTETEECGAIQLYVTWKQRLLGYVNINDSREISNPSRLYETIANGLKLNLLQLNYNLDKDFLQAEITSTLTSHFSANQTIQDSSVGLSPEVKVSIVVATYDRPEDLSQCLR
ncbi:glycosyltransferase, partial [Chitinophagaceae bacterium LB-8]